MKANIIVVMFLLSINIYCLRKYVTLKRISSEQMEFINSKADAIINHQDIQVKLSFRYVGNKLNNIVVIDSVGNESTFAMVMSDMNIRKAFVCRLSEHFCASCNEDALNKFKNVVRNVGIKDAIYLCTCHEKRFMKKYLLNLGLMGVNVFFVDENTFPIDGMGYPYYIVIDNERNINAIYMPSKTTSDMDSIYLNEMYNLQLAKDA